MNKLKVNQEWLTELTQKFEEYQDTLAWSNYGENEIETLTGEIYCPCSVCDVRETMAFFVPQILTAIEHGMIIANEKE